jgi:hypothetical protein
MAETNGKRGQHGGRRAGAGRKKGSRNKRSLPLIEQATQAELELPLPRLLRRMNDPTVDERHRDAIAAICAPYCHARFFPRPAEAAAPDPDMMSDEELAAFIAKCRVALARPAPHLRQVK